MAATRQMPVQQQTPRPKNPMSIESLINTQSVAVFITTSRLTVSLFVRNIIINLTPFFSAIIPFVLPALVFIITPFTIEIHTMLIDILNERIMLTISVLF